MLFTVPVSRSVLRRSLSRLSTWPRLLLCVCTLLALVCLFWFQPHPMAVAPTRGSGAGGIGQAAHLPAGASVNCLTDGPGPCLAQSVFSWVATQIQQAIQPLTDAVLKNAVDIIYQTPAGDSYQNAAVVTLNTAFVGVVDAALVLLLVIGAYNVIIGAHLSLPHASFGELVARVVVVMGAVHFNLWFLGQFIELENALALQVDHTAGIAQLANLLAGIVTNPGETLLAFLLMVIICFFVLWLLGQMIVRIALVALGLATAPLGLACLMLPQTMRWGRLWLTTFASAVIVQFVQIVALSLGGIFITELAATSLIRLDQQFAVAFLSIGMLFLVLKIPGMIQQWALYPMMQFGNRHHGSGEGGGGSGTGSSGDSGATMGWEDASSGAGAGWQGQAIYGADGALALFI